MLANSQPTQKTFRETIRFWIDAALDLIYPPVCRSCDQHLSRRVDAQGLERWLCTDCAEQLHAIKPPYCSRCGEAYDGALEVGFRCENCSDRELAFEFAIAPWRSQGVARDLILAFKYGRDLSLRGCMGDLLLPIFQEPRLQAEPLHEWLLVPVPLHATRLRDREFNQSEEIALRAARVLGSQVINPLLRRRDTGHQASLSRAARLTNLRSAFALKRAWKKSGGRLVGRKVLLVDDVFTTGATADACARILRRDAGVEKVVVITVARG
jgi:competence protein ComFC